MTYHHSTHRRVHPSRGYRASCAILAACGALACAGSLAAAEAEHVQVDTRGGVVTADVPKTDTTKKPATRTTRIVEGKESKTVVAEKTSPGLNIHGLININISDHYFTPRGLDVENSGVIVQPLVLLFWGLYHNEKTFVDDVTLTTGVWNSVHSRQSGPKHDNWNEIDPIFDLSFGFARDFKFEVDYTIFRSQNGSFATSQNLELKLDFDDSKIMGAFALHPYAGVFIELFNKATFANTRESYYAEFGVDPTYTFASFPTASYPLKLEAPSYITFPEHNFYGRDSVVGVVSTGLKASVPLAFIPATYGHWTYYAQEMFYSLQNPALIKNGDFARNGKPNHSEFVFSSGLTIAF